MVIVKKKSFGTYQEETATLCGDATKMASKHGYALFGMTIGKNTEKGQISQGLTYEKKWKLGYFKPY